MLDSIEIDKIATAVADKMQCTQHCKFGAFSEEETLMLRRWIKIMDDTGIWLIRTIRYGVAIVIGAIVWLSITHNMWNPTQK